jgi:hypothetical protein
MKKIVLGISAFLVIIFIAGCGLKDKIVEEVTDKTIENVTGGKVDIDEDKVIINGENGEKAVIGKTEWPNSELVKNIPEFDKGSIIAVYDNIDSVGISLEDIKKEDAATYYELIKKEFAEEIFESSSDDSIIYIAKNQNGTGVMLQYYGENLVITVTKTSE